MECNAALMSRGCGAADFSPLVEAVAAKRHDDHNAYSLRLQHQPTTNRRPCGYTQRDVTDEKAPRTTKQPHPLRTHEPIVWGGKCNRFYGPTPGSLRVIVPHPRHGCPSTAKHAATRVHGGVFWIRQCIYIWYIGGLP